MSCFKADNYVVIFLHDKFSFMFFPDVLSYLIYFAILRPNKRSKCMVRGLGVIHRGEKNPFLGKTQQRQVQDHKVITKLFTNLRPGWSIRYIGSRVLTSSRCSKLARLSQGQGASLTGHIVLGCHIQEAECLCLHRPCCTHCRGTGQVRGAVVVGGYQG